MFKAYLKKIKKLTQKAFEGKVRVVFSCKNTLRKTLMHVKPERDPLFKNSVYKIRCEYDAEYTLDKHAGHSLQDLTNTKTKRINSK
jgi:hypothetical protein